MVSVVVIVLAVAAVALLAVSAATAVIIFRRARRGLDTGEPFHRRPRGSGSRRPDSGDTGQTWDSSWSSGD